MKILLLIVLLISVFINPIIAQKDTCTQKVTISEIKIYGNKKTKDFIIKRELTFAVGDTLCRHELSKKNKENKINLLKTPLFNDVLIYSENIGENQIKINIKVTERWYLWPDVRLDYADRNFSVWWKNRDFSRTDIGGGIMKYNFRGRNERLYFYAIFGYNQTFALSYSGLYLDKKRQHSISYDIKYLTRKETVFDILNNQTAQIKLDDENILQSLKTSIGYKIRKKIHVSHDFYFGYENRQVADTLLVINPDYFVDNIKKAEYFFIRYIFINDKRDRRIFPVGGYKFSVVFNKLGLGILQNGNINFAYIVPKFSKYTSLSKRFSISNNITGKKSIGNKQPFFLESALGMGDNIRGFEYYQINGTDFILTNNSINFELLPQKTFKLGIIPFSQFNKIPLSMFLSINFDAAYVFNTNEKYSENNSYVNTPLYSSGISLNIISYYDTLIRLEYSLTNFLQHGFFIHFSAAF